jgi:hypothetical protein
VHFQQYLEIDGGEKMEKVKEIAAQLGQWAPAIGTALAGVTGGISAPIGIALGALAKVFGLPEDSKPDDILNAITADPQARLKIMQAENEFKVKMAEIKIQELGLHLDDSQDARKMRVEHEKVTGKGDLNLYILAWVVVAGFFGLVLALLNIELPKDQNGVVFMLFGSLATGFGQVLQFFFGSSKGSTDKTELLARAPAIK